MVEKKIIAYLGSLHGLYNFSVLLLLVYQASLGLKIRRGRKGGRPNAKAIKKHRRFGPIWVVMGVTGFLAGISVAYLDQGSIFNYPPHFTVGLIIAVSLVTTFVFSRMIKGIKSPWRNRHFALGIFIISIYLLQISIGLRILLSLLDLYL